jgi:ABC-type amino acid transport substrate-binding protein
VIGTADLTVGDKITNLDPSTGRPGGYEVDVLQAFFESEAAKAGIKTPIVINHYGASGGWGDGYFHMLRDHTDVDLLASGITPTPQRQRDWNVRFSEPSLKFPNVLLVRSGTKAVENGQIIIKHIGVADNTTNKDFILRYFASDPARVLVAPLPKPYHTMSDWLFFRTIDGMLIDELYVPTIRTDYPELATGTDVVVLDPKVNSRFEYSSAAYALRPEDDALLDALDKFIVENAGVRKAISERYFPDMEFLP